MSVLVERRRVRRKPVVIHLPFPISVNEIRGWRKYPSTDYEEWQWRAKAALVSQRPRRIMGPVTITLTYADRGRSDIDNLAKGVLDILVREHIIEDDNRRVLRRLDAVWGYVEGVRIEIIPLESK